MDYENQFLNYCNGAIWKDDTPPKLLKSLSCIAFNDMKKEKTKSKNLIRICGQSGSGKTTQLLEGVKRITEEKKLKPVIIAVRNFATYHPHYNELINMYGKAEIRERTNGFALKLLCFTLIKFITSGYFVVMDITLLSSEFEKIVFNLLNENGYKINYLIMSVPRMQSDMFIQKRMQTSLSEGSRVVYKSSADYFYDVLDEGILYLTQTDKISNAVIYSAYHKDPRYYGPVKDCYPIFYACRKRIEKIVFGEKELLEAKIEFFRKNINFT